MAKEPKSPPGRRVPTPKDVGGSQTPKPGRPIRKPPPPAPPPGKSDR